MVRVFPRNGSHFDLEELQQIVGGYIEALSLDNGWMILNEDGKYQGLPYNKKATDVAAYRLGSGDYIAGNVLICDTNQFK